MVRCAKSFPSSMAKSKQTCLGSRWFSTWPSEVESALATDLSTCTRQRRLGMHAGPLDSHFSFASVLEWTGRLRFFLRRILRLAFFILSAQVSRTPPQYWDRLTNYFLSENDASHHKQETNKVQQTTLLCHHATITKNNGETLCNCYLF